MTIQGEAVGAAPLVDGSATALHNHAGAAPATVKLTADEVGKTDAILVNTGLSVAVANGSYYHFKFVVLYRSTSLSVGIRLALTFPAANAFGAEVLIGGSSTAGATVEPYPGAITTSGGVIASPQVRAADTDYVATIEGVISPSASGTLMVQYAAETTGATVTMRQGSCGILTAL